MSLDTEQKREVVAKFGRGAADTGSPEVQVALLSERINQLSDHFTANAVAEDRRYQGDD